MLTLNIFNIQYYLTLNFRMDKAGSQNLSRANSPTLNSPPMKHREFPLNKDVVTGLSFNAEDPPVINKPPVSSINSNFPQTVSIKKKKNSKEMDPNLGPAPLFANSTVDIISVCLNEEMLKENNGNSVKSEMSRSTPDIQKDFQENNETNNLRQKRKEQLSKRAESEPSLPFLIENEEPDSDS